MATTLEKRSAEEWAAWLLEQDLPSTNRTATDLLAELDDAPRTFQAMSDDIQEDPVLALKLLSRANTALDTKETLVKTLSHALSLLGVDFLRDLLSSVRIEDSETSPAARRFHYRMGRSFVAAHIARALAQYHFPKQSDEVFWAALFRGIPAWYLARMVDDQDHPPAELRGFRRAQWQGEHWGADEESIWRQMIPRLGLPERVTRAQLPTERETLHLWARLERLCPQEGTPSRPEDRALRMLVQSPDTLVILANWLEDEIRLSWLSPTVDKLFRIGAMLTGQPVAEVVRTVHEAVVDAANLHDNPGTAAAARRLVAEQKPPVLPATDSRPATPRPEIPPRADIPPEQTESSTQATAAAPPKAAILETPVRKAPPPVKKPQPDAALAKKAAPVPGAGGLQVRTAASTAREAPHPQPERARRPTEPALRVRQGNDSLYEEITEMMFRQPHKFKDVPALMNAACQCMTYGIGLKTAMIALCSNDRSRLKSYYSQGFTARTAFRNWSQPLEGNHLFSRLMQGPSGIWIKPQSSEKVWNSLPADFRNQMNTDQCFMMSVFVKSKPIALVYADDGTDGPHLTEADYAKFKHVCAGISQVLYYFAMQRKKQQKKSPPRT